MKKQHCNGLTAALAALLVGALTAHATTSSVSTMTNTSPKDAMTALFGDPVIVKGTGIEIKRSALDQIMVNAKTQAAAQNQQLPPNLEAQALDQLITVQVLLQKATEADKAAGQSEVEQQYTNIVKHFGSEEAFGRQLKAAGLTVSDWRTKAAQQATVLVTIKRELNVAVTDEDVKKFYTDHPGDFEEAEKAHVRHLLLMTIDPTTQAPLAADVIASKRKQIDDLLKRARAGEDFATLAKQYSEDPGSKDSGGEYTFPRGQMVPEFEAASFSMTNSQISDVVTTKYGFHIIKLLERLPAKKVELATVTKDIRSYLEKQQVNKGAPAYITNLKSTLKVEIVDPALKAAMDAAEAAAKAASASGSPGGM